MFDKALSTVQKYDMLSQNDSVVVGFSGGADSCALLHFLISLRDKFNLTVSACHINHQLRGAEADRDENFVSEMCRKYSVPLYILHADVKAESIKRKISTEQCGRDIRYAFFAETADKLHAKIATAHTASDNAETVLFNLTRGSGAAGLCGIPPMRDNIIRPLISCTRTEIESYCLQHSLPYVTDSTNLTDEYTRNKIRLEVMPVLKKINPSFENTVSAMTEHMKETVDFIDKCAENALSRCLTKKGYPISELQKLDKAVLSKAIILLCQKNSFTPEAKHIELIRKIVYNNGAVELRNNLFAISKQGFLRIAEISPLSEMPEVHWNGQEILSINNKIISLSKINKAIFHNRKKFDKIMFHNSLDCDTIPLTAVFRTRKQGDVFSPVGRNITKSVKKLFIELKIPSERRDDILMLADGSEIIWIDGIGVSQKYSVRDTSQNIVLISAVQQNAKGNQNEQ